MTFFIKTFGCQMNVNDSEKIRHILEEKGYTAAPGEKTADLIVVNTCAVRQKPQEKVYSYIGRIPPGKKIIVAGCVAQLEKEKLLKRNRRIDGVIGTHQFYHIGRMLGEGQKQPEKNIAVAFSRGWQELVPALGARQSPVTAYISIMEGCNNFCTYCIVPHVRGREKHRPFKDIVREAEYLAKNQYQEIILLGQNVNNWQDQKERISFPNLLEHLAARIGVRWIRFITSYPGYHDQDLIRVIAENRAIARHIHFPAQSGSSRILKKMGRNYSRSQYLKIIADFKKAIPEMKFSSDFIVGFPGESESDFRLTLTLLETVAYESVFSFIYSPRPYTRAFTLKDDVRLSAKKERLYRLQELQEKIQSRENHLLIGQTLEVLITEKNPKKKNEVIGRTESYRVVNFESQTPVGRWVKVSIQSAGPHSLRGKEVALK